MKKIAKDEVKRKTALDVLNCQKLTLRQEIEARYNQRSKENLGILTEDRGYKFILCRGNNHQLVKKVMETRDYWTEN